MVLKCIGEGGNDFLQRCVCGFVVVVVVVVLAFWAFILTGQPLDRKQNGVGVLGLVSPDSNSGGSECLKWNSATSPPQWCFDGYSDKVWLDFHFSYFDFLAVILCWWMPVVRFIKIYIYFEMVLLMNPSVSVSSLKQTVENVNSWMIQGEVVTRKVIKL